MAFSPSPASSLFPSVGSSDPGLQPARFAWIRDLLEKKAGITLDAGKEYLVETRLGALAKTHGHASVDALVHALSLGSANHLQDAVIELLTTNETLFFRDLHPFDALQHEVLPNLIRLRQSTRTLRFWSAACSTGQEPYSLAMMLEENFPELGTWRTEILGTDLANHVLERARTARYQSFEVNRGLPARSLVRFFQQEGANWLLKDEIRRKVTFRQHNLIGSWAGIAPKFDVIFMRNVLIYFSIPTRRQILNEVKKVLAPDGYLILGNAETAVTLDQDFQPVPIRRATFFQRR
jgi:chemotaxis protein methyltransferase CheR